MKKQLEAITPDERLRIVRLGLFEDVPTAAKRCKVSKTTIYHWLDNGEIAEMQTGNKRFVLTESLNAKLAADIRLPDTGNIPSHLRGADRKLALRDVMLNHQRTIHQATA